MPRAYLLLEALLIVLSVLLGFGISEWGQRRADEQLGRRVLETIHREVTANRDQLTEVVANHEEVLRQMRDPDDDSYAIRPAILRNSAWSTAQATGATVHLDYDITEVAARLHELQGLQRDAQITTLERLSEINFAAGQVGETEVRRARVDLWAGLVGLERRLLAEYERAMTILPGTATRGAVAASATPPARAASPSPGGPEKD